VIAIFRILIIASDTRLCSSKGRDDGEVDEEDCRECDEQH